MKGMEARLFLCPCSLLERLVFRAQQATPILETLVLPRARLLVWHRVCPTTVFPFLIRKNETKFSCFVQKLSQNFQTPNLLIHLLLNYQSFVSRLASLQLDLLTQVAVALVPVADQCFLTSLIPKALIVTRVPLLCY